MAGAGVTNGCWEKKRVIHRGADRKGDAGGAERQKETERDTQKGTERDTHTERDRKAQKDTHTHTQKETERQRKRHHNTHSAIVKQGFRFWD